MKYESLAQEILKEVGGSENVLSLTHCMTRLRFNLKNDSKANKENMKNIKGVVSCVNKGGQFQVVIGTHVEDVYNVVCELGNIRGNAIEKETKEKKTSISMFFDTIAGIFMPIVGALAGSGMVKAILAIATSMDWITTTSQTYVVLYMISDVVFYYLPCFIAISAAKKFKCSPFLALLFAGILVHPTLVGLKAAGNPVSFLEIPITLASYSSSVVPIILIVFFQSYIERFAKKIAPNAVKTFLVPLITIMIVAPVGLIALGPLGAILGGYLASFFNFLNDRVSWIVPTLVGAFAPLLVMTGMHYSLGAVQATQRAAVGYATILAPGMIASNMAQAAATFAVSFRTKNSELKTLASSCAITALCGITEPALYGVNMKLKRPLYATMLAGGCAGLYAGITATKAWSAGTSNIFALPIYIGADNSSFNVCVTVAIALVLGFVFSFILYKEPVENTNTDTISNEQNVPANKKQVLITPLSGKIVALENVEDDAFSSLAMGKGIAIQPDEGIVYAPFDGTVEMLFNTKHAIGLKSDSGIELLIHIGIDTVKLNGKFFENYVESGVTIKKGQKLLQFNIEKINNAGYNCITPLIITNSHEYLDIIEVDTENVKKDDIILTVIQ